MPSLSRAVRPMDTLGRDSGREEAPKAKKLRWIGRAGLDWGLGARVPALCVSGPEFEPQGCKINKAQLTLPLSHCLRDTSLS